MHYRNVTRHGYTQSNEIAFCRRSFVFLPLQLLFQIHSQKNATTASFAFTCSYILQLYCKYNLLKSCQNRWKLWKIIFFFVWWVFVLPFFFFHHHFSVVSRLLLLLVRFFCVCFIYHFFRFLLVSRALYKLYLLVCCVFFFFSLCTSLFGCSSACAAFRASVKNERAHTRFEMAKKRDILKVVWVLVARCLYVHKWNKQSKWHKEQ